MLAAAKNSNVNSKYSDEKVMQLEQFLSQVASAPDTVEFTDTMAVIDAHYSAEETAFDNGGLHNEAGQNMGSCKLFAFAQRHQLSESATLACFGHYYRDHVLGNPDGDDHQNIRNFMNTGWSGIQFSVQPLTALAER